MDRPFFGNWTKNINLDESVSLGIAFFFPAVISFVWISLPLFLLRLQISLVWLGIIYSVGIVSSLVVRVPLRFYLERGRNDILPMVSVLFSGISLSIFYLSFNPGTVLLAFIVLSVSSSIYRISLKQRQERNLRNIEPMRNMYSQDLVPTVGIFTVLVLSGLFPGSNLVELFGMMSVVTLLLGFLSLAYTLSHKAVSSEFVQKTSLTELAKNAISPLRSFDKITNRRVVFPYLAIQSLLYLSICIVSIFFPAMALLDGIEMHDIYFIFAAFAVIGFLLDRLAHNISVKPIRDVFYIFRPIFLIIPFLVLSIVISSLLFIVGYFIVLMWIFSDSASSDLMLSAMGEGDQIRSRILMTFLSWPISIIGPLLGSVMWLASPRLLYGVSIIPAAVSMLIVMLMLERYPSLSSSHTT